MISQTAEYALRATVFLAGRSASSREPCTTQEIAAATHVPAGYLLKVLQNLARAGLIASQRGIGGGFWLARPAAEISVFDVIQAVDALPRIRQCPLGLEAHALRLCALHRKLDSAMDMVEQAFRTTNVAELVDEPASDCPAAALAAARARG